MEDRLSVVLPDDAIDQSGWTGVRPGASTRNSPAKHPQIFAQLTPLFGLGVPPLCAHPGRVGLTSDSHWWGPPLTCIQLKAKILMRPPDLNGEVGASQGGHTG